MEVLIVLAGVFQGLSWMWIWQVRQGQLPLIPWIRWWLGRNARPFGGATQRDWRNYRNSPRTFQVLAGMFCLAWFTALFFDLALGIPAEEMPGTLTVALFLTLVALIAYVVYARGKQNKRKSGKQPCCSHRTV